MQDNATYVLAFPIGMAMYYRKGINMSRTLGIYPKLTKVPTRFCSATGAY
jgi:hypothetical protein